MPLAEIELLLRQSMGLDAASVGISTVERAVRQRMATCGLETVNAYWDHLRDSPPELQELVETIVVPETWFFRDEESFGTLAQIVSGEIIPSRPADSLKILSIPCSTGEEPYSVVMALKDAGVTANRMIVDAVDISARALAWARRGIYKHNSFRSHNLAFRDRHFRLTPDGYAVADWISRTVKFHQGNLVSGHLPLSSIPYDVIFCRNILIYFDRPTQERVMTTLSAMLASSGILFVGHAEAYLAASCGFSAVSAAASFAFKKATVKRPETAEEVLPKTPARVRYPPSQAPPPPAKRGASHAAESNDTEPFDLEAAQRWADQGQLEKAADCCERHVARQGPSAEAYYLLGVVRSASGDHAQVAECLRRALFLQPDHVEALTHLALLSEKQRDFTAAQRFRERARRASACVEPKRGLTP
jgi:chemotaxis protein methyltransferase WspC